MAMPDPIAVATKPAAPPQAARGWLSPLNRRRWDNFKANRRAFWSLMIFAVLYGLSLFAEFIANDRPILVQYQGSYYTPIFNFYPETEFGGDFRTEAVYRDVEVQCLIISGGLQDCWDDPEGVIEIVEATGSFNGERVAQGWLPFRHRDTHAHTHSMLQVPLLHLRRPFFVFLPSSLGTASNHCCDSVRAPFGTHALLVPKRANRVDNVTLARDPP